uniref:Uncharacterized protein n=1 Tax=Anguilla anguilla TaxID=7936 RepID=A0A0E9TIF6_ANGAN
MGGGGNKIWSRQSMIWVILFTEGNKYRQSSRNKHKTVSPVHS